MPNNVRNRDGDIYTPYGWELHNCSEITEEEEASLDKLVMVLLSTRKEIVEI